MRFEIIDLFASVGFVEMNQKGLYFEYTAELFDRPKQFTRLYFHSEERCIRLGLLEPSGERFVCKGQISLNRLGSLQENACFSTLTTRWAKGSVLPDGTALSQNVLQSVDADIHTVLFPRNAPFPEELVKYFCFVEPAVIAGQDCMLLQLDAFCNPKQP